MAVAAVPASYPVRVEARLDSPSRLLWLVKWILAVPHLVILTFLWIAYCALTAFAFFAILVTGRYPRAIFEFNAGVLRWTWRVLYYSFGANGTDRYPPFTLADVADYPAHLEVAYPEHLSRGLVLVKWWLLAIPQYIVVGIFVGGGTVAAWQGAHAMWGWGGGLIGLLVLLAVMALAVTGRYPQGLFDLILGMNRWVLRVVGYAGLMTDIYPPFRMDLGGSEGGVVSTKPPPPSVGAESPARAPDLPASPPTTAGGWTGGRITAVVLGALLGLLALGMSLGGGAILLLNGLGRDPAGFLVSPARTLTTPTYAITTGSIDLRTRDLPRMYPSRILGTARIRVTPQDPTQAVFVGIAPTARVEAYLRGVARSTVDDLLSKQSGPGVAGGPPRTAPAVQPFWTAARWGKGTQTLYWRPRTGAWTVVVMNADGSRPVMVRADVGARVPALPWIGAGLLSAGVLLLIAAILLLAIPIARASRAATPGFTSPAAPPGSLEQA